MRCGKTAIATCLGLDNNDVDSYQPTVERGIFTSGGLYYTSVPKGKKPPKGPPAMPWHWKLVKADWFTQKYQIEVYQSEP